MQHLSPRHRELVWLLAQGKRYKQIAYEMGVSEGTVKVYVYNIGRRLGCQGGPEIVALYWQDIIAQMRYPF